MIRSERRMDGAVLRLALDAPKGNVLSEAMLGAIVDALSDVQNDTRLIVFEGAGKHFSFGASVEEHRAPQAQSMLTAFHGLFRELAKLAVPTCAVV